MAASFTLPSLLPFFCFDGPPPSPMEEHSHSDFPRPIFSLILLFALSVASFSIVVHSLHRRLKKAPHRNPVPKFVSGTEVTHESDATHMTRSHLLEILPSNSPKWATLFGADPVSNESGVSAGTADSDCEKKKKRKKGKKKKKKTEEDGAEGMREKGKQDGEDFVCLYPFTSSSSATQRKIKQQYDQLIKSHGANGLTLAQMGDFVNCLVEARNDLKHKSEIIQRKFTITKALLLKADRSSFDRLCQQIHKLELEQKRLEEDASVYNWLQQQLKLSPAYKKMLEIGASMELKAKSIELTNSTDDDEFSDISFEEFLAQEKKDSFWQKHGKHRSCAS